MTEYDYYKVYKSVRDANHSDHVRAVVDLIKQVNIFEPDMTVSEFYKLKMKFMQRYFNESLEKYEIKEKG